MRRGYTLVWCGWQHDVPAVDGLMRAHLPEAQHAGGPVSGKLLVSFQPNGPTQTQLLSDRGHRAYPASDLGDPNAALLVRDNEGAPPQAIPRDQWCFARIDGERVVPDAAHIYLAAGFVPGKLYHVVYTTSGAPVIGLGLLTARDIVAFLRHGSDGRAIPAPGTSITPMPSAPRRAGAICASCSISASTRTRRSAWSLTGCSSTLRAASAAATSTSASASPRPRCHRT